jgi:hypothetical protein
MMLADQHRDVETDFDSETKRIFEQHYLANLRGNSFICLESKDFDN